MRLMRIAPVSILGILMCSPFAAGQQPSPPDGAQSSTLDRVDVSGAAAPLRVIRTSTRQGDRESITDTVQAPNAEGRLAPVDETVVETVRAGRIVNTRTDRFRFDGSGRRKLTEISESVEDSSVPGRTEVTATTWRSDLNGRLSVAARIDENTTETAGARSSERTVHRTDLDGRLRPEERTEHAERRTSPEAVESVVTELRTDINNRWQVTETRSRSVRATGAGADSTEEVVYRTDPNGISRESERSVRHSTRQNGHEELTIETFSDRDAYRAGSNGGVKLAQRIRRATTPSADGGHQVIEEVEERNPVALEDPLRTVRRTVETVRRIGPGRWDVETQIFERDPNHRLVLTVVEREQRASP